MKAIVVAGGIAQAELINELKTRGIYTILVDKDRNAYAVKFADEFYSISTLDIEGIKQLAIDKKVDMVVTACADQVLLVVSKVSEDLGLPCYIDYKTAQLVSDKQYMKAIFEQNCIPTSKHIVMRELDEKELSKFEFPLIVKPVDCYSSRGVRRVESCAELREAFKEAAQLSRAKTVIIEEFCEGTELTVDVYVEDGVSHVLTISISDKIADKDRFVIYRTKNPAKISEDIKKKIEVACQQIVDAFKLKNCPMLVQMITNGKRIDILEFCARTGGCIKYQLIRKATGFDVIKAVVDLTLGLKPHVGQIVSEDKYIVNTFLYCKPGVFDHVNGMDFLMEQEIISDYAVFAYKGRIYSQVTCSGDRVCSFTIQGKSIEELNKKSKLAMEKIQVIDINGNDILRHELVEEIEF